MTDTSDDQAEPSIPQRFYESLMASREISREQLAQYQREVATTLVEYVCQRSNWHAERLSPVLAAGKPDFSRWGEVPILGKQELLANYHRLRIDDIPKGHGRLILTESSSSTGISVALPKTQMTDTATACAAFRHATVFKLDNSRPLVMVRSLNAMLARQRSHDVEAEIARKPPDRSRWGPDWLPRELRGPRHYLSVSLPCEGVLDRLDAIGEEADGCYLNTSPSKALELANHVRRKQRPHPKLKAILSVGELVTPSHRHEVRSYLGAEMIDVYATAETGPVAMQCPASGLYHTQSELGWVELLDDAGRPVKPGQIGRVIVSPFYNLAMPLLRFDTGDLAMAGASCTCNSPHPVVTRLVGRSASQIRTADGSLIHWSPDFEAMRAYLGECRWRLDQSRPGRIEVQYMQTADGEAIDENGAVELTQSLCRTEDLEITVREVDVLGLTGGGKFALTHRLCI